jgi:YHS domain-containing protein
MVRRAIGWMIGAFFLAGLSVSCGADKSATTQKAMKPQTVCPVSAKKIDRKIYVDYKGRRIYFCCKACPAVFKKDPEKYLRKMKEQGVTPEKIRRPQTECPVLGGKVDKKIYTDYRGKRIYFCCSGCIAEFKKSPDKYMKQMADQGIAAEPIPHPQTTCPIMGGKINKEVYTDYKGKRIYFCCKGCPETFKKNPAGYLKKMEEEGVVLAKTPVR